MLGISRDTVAENRAFAEKFSFPYPLLCDVDGAVSLAYGAIGSEQDLYPKRISYLVGADGTVLKAYAKVDPTGHPDEVLADL